MLGYWGMYFLQGLVELSSCVWRVLKVIPNLVCVPGVRSSSFEIETSINHLFSILFHCYLTKKDVSDSLKGVDLIPRFDRTSAVCGTIYKGDF